MAQPMALYAQRMTPKGLRFQAAYAQDLRDHLAIARGSEHSLSRRDAKWILYAVGWCHGNEQFRPHILGVLIACGPDRLERDKALAQAIARDQQLVAALLAMDRMCGTGTWGFLVAEEGVGDHGVLLRAIEDLRGGHGMRSVEELVAIDPIGLDAELAGVVWACLQAAEPDPELLCKRLSLMTPSQQCDVLEGAIALPLQPSAARRWLTRLSAAAELDTDVIRCVVAAWGVYGDTTRFVDELTRRSGEKGASILAAANKAKARIALRASNDLQEALVLLRREPSLKEEICLLGCRCFPRLFRRVLLRELEQLSTHVSPRTLQYLLMTVAGHTGPDFQEEDIRVLVRVLEQGGYLGSLIAIDALAETGRVKSAALPLVTILRMKKDDPKYRDYFSHVVAAFRKARREEVQTYLSQIEEEHPELREQVAAVRDRLTF